MSGFLVEGCGVGEAVTGEGGAGGTAGEIPAFEAMDGARGLVIGW
jgi:hypothetical protein